MTVLKSSNSVVCRSVEPLFPGWILWIHDISVGLFLPPIRCHQVLRMCAFLFQLKFSELTVLVRSPLPRTCGVITLGLGSPERQDAGRQWMTCANNWKTWNMNDHDYVILWHIMAYYGILWHIMAYHGILSFFRMKFLWRFFEVASSDDISRFRQLAVQVLRVNPQQTQWRLPMTDPWCCHIYVYIYMPYMVTWIPSIYPSHVSINIPAPWIRHGAHHSIIFYDIYSYQRLPVLYTTPQHHHSKATLLALLRRLRRLMMNSSIRNLAMKQGFIWKLGYDVWFYSKLYIRCLMMFDDVRYRLIG